MMSKNRLKPYHRADVYSDKGTNLRFKLHLKLLIKFIVVVCDTVILKYGHKNLLIAGRNVLIIHIIEILVVADTLYTDNFLMCFILSLLRTRYVCFRQRQRMDRSATVSHDHL